MKILITFLCILFFSDAFAINCYTLNSPAILYTIGETNPAATNTVTITRTSNASGCSNYFLGFTKGGSASYSRLAHSAALNADISYNIYKNSDGTGILKDKPDIVSNSETFLGTIANNQVIASSYYFIVSGINSTSPPRFGTYTDTLVLKDYHGTWNTTSTLDDTINVNVTITVPKLIQLSLQSSGDVFDSSQTSKILDFGILEENEELSFDIKVVSNAGYNVSVASENSGKLKHGTAAGVNALIDYEFYANNTLKGLSSSPVSIATGTGLTPAGGASVPIRVKIGQVDNKIEGDYQDVITVSVVSTD